MGPGIESKDDQKRGCDLHSQYFLLADMVNKNQNFKRGGAMGCDLHGFGLPMHPNESRPGIEIQMSK